MKSTFQIWISAEQNASPAACCGFSKNPLLKQSRHRFYLNASCLFYWCNLAHRERILVTFAPEKQLYVWDKFDGAATCRIEWRHTISVKRVHCVDCVGCVGCVGCVNHYVACVNCVNCVNQLLAGSTSGLSGFLALELARGIFFSGFLSRHRARN